MGTKWSWLLAAVAGFGETIFEVRADEWGQTQREFVTIRRVTIIVTNGQGISLAKWTPQMKLGDGNQLLSGETVQLRRSSIIVVGEPTKKLENDLLEIWSGIVTTPPNGRPRMLGG